MKNIRCFSLITLTAFFFCHDNKAQQNSAAITLKAMHTVEAGLDKDANGENIVIVNDVSAYASEKIIIEVEVENDDEVIAFQMDFELPEGFIYVEDSATLSERSDGHSVASSVIEANVLRIVSFSGSNASYIGDSGVMLYFELYTPDEEGEWELLAEEVVLSGTNSTNVFTGSYPGTITLVKEQDEDTYTVTFVLKAEDGEEVSNANVTFNGVENGPGDYVFENIKPGTYSYTVSADGYEDVEGSVKVTDKDVVKEVVLEEEEDDPDDTYVDTHDGFELSIYPNPARNKVNVESSITIKQVRLLNINGLVIYEKVIDGLNAEVCINNLLTGIYFLQMLTDEGISTRRIQVIR